MGELTEPAGVSTRSPRYYEVEGLLRARPAANGYREYGHEDLPGGPRGPMAPQRPPLRRTRRSPPTRSPRRSPIPPSPPPAHGRTGQLIP
ncbi:MerR family transcriptional regulator [Streptomyces sp. NPDC048516]|uniref:MerR family transcriptional regulator n=1 Tax=Streptomyces sp. NPDC048516 TaxID=3365565 RepID=UPI00372489B7